jgi:hypothetical protein
LQHEGADDRGWFGSHWLLIAISALAVLINLGTL